MMSGTRASSMLSTRAMEGGWPRASSHSGAAEADEAPGSTTTSSMASRDTEDSCSPEDTSRQRPRRRRRGSQQHLCGVDKRELILDVSNFKLIYY